MTFKYYIVTFTAIVLLFFGTLFIVLNSSVVNKETTSINNDNKYKINAKKGAYVATEEFNNIETDTLTKKQKRIIKRIIKKDEK